MRAANFAPLLMLTLSVASCVQHEPVSLEKRLLISGILKLYSTHRILSDEELTGAFHLAPKDFEKSCVYNCDGAETLMERSPQPSQAVTAFVISGVVDQSVRGGWAGEQITIVFNHYGHYCLRAEEFALATALEYKIEPAGLLVERGASVSWPARYVFTDPGGRNIIRFDPGCVRYTTIVIYFDRPDPD
jgi:hypothetical protein